MFARKMPRDLPTAELGTVQPEPGRLNSLLRDDDASPDDPVLSRGAFSLVGGVAPENGSVEHGGLALDIGGNLFAVVFLEEQRLQDVVRSEITQLRNEVGVNDVGEIGIGEGVSIARELLAPGSGLAAGALGELVDPVVGLAKGALGLGESAQIRDVAQQLAYQGVTPESFNPRGDEFRSLVASRAPNLVPPEALEMDASMPSPADDLLESSALADGTMAMEESLDAERGRNTAANEGVGNSYTGVIESMDDDFVLQRVGDDLVSHRAELFDDRAADRELAIGKSLEISYEHDGPSVSTPRLARDLGLER